MTVAIITNQGAIPYYNPTILVDNSNINPYYYGGEKITTGNPNGIDVYTYVLIRKAGSAAGAISNQITVLYSQAQYTQIP
jgi:hypothetical protein